MYTEQELVRHILFVQNEDSTADIGSQHPAVQQARMHLTNMKKEFLGRGWWFNREYKRKLLPDSVGVVYLPEETMSFTVTPAVLYTQSPAGKMRYVKRGDRVYDSVEHTFNIGCALLADLIVDLPYEDLPTNAGTYLKYLAGNTAFRASDGDMQVKRDMDVDLEGARQRLFAEELRVTGANALDSPQAQNLLMGIGQQGSGNPRLPGGRSWMR